MRRALFILIGAAMLLLAACAWPPPGQAATKYVINATGLTGGAAGDLDSYTLASGVTTGWRAQVMTGGTVYFFEFDGEATAAEDVSGYPRVIRPDDYASAGNWEEQAPYVELNSTSDLVIGNYIDKSGVTIEVDPTEIGSVTWGSGSDTTWTFHTSGASPYVTFGNDSITIANIATWDIPSDAVYQIGGVQALAMENDNITMGDGAGASITSGVSNYLIGSQAGASLTEGDKCIAIGNRAMYTNTTGDYLIAIGHLALYSNEAGGVQNVGIGYRACYSTSTGDYNVGIGYDPLYTNSTGGQNVAIGISTLYSNTSGNANMAAGYQSLYANTEGLANCAIGSQAAYSNTTGDYNFGLGYRALYTNSTGSYNIGIGNNAVYGNAMTGSYNIGIGDSALYKTSSGTNNVGIGNSALTELTTGQYNVGIGDSALNKITEGIANSGVGLQSLYSITTGDYNAALGTKALFENETGSYNIGIGYNAGEHDDGGNDVTNASSCVIIGAEADFDTATPTNEIVIGATADGIGDNTVTLGNNNIVETYLKGALSNYPMTETFTTEADLTDPLTSTVVLLDGDNDGDNDTLQLQDGIRAGQIVVLIAYADIDADDTVTIDTTTDSTCTNCPAIVFNKVGENVVLVWTGSTWVVLSLQDGL